MLTTLDFLYLSLGIGFIFLVLFGVVALVQVILVIRDIRKISETAGDLTENFHSIVATPLYYVGKVAHFVGPKFEEAIRSRFGDFDEKKK